MARWLPGHLESFAPVLELDLAGNGSVSCCPRSVVLVLGLLRRDVAAAVVVVVVGREVGIVAVAVRVGWVEMRAALIITTKKKGVLPSLSLWSSK